MDRFLVFYTYRGKEHNIVILANSKKDAIKTMDYYDVVDVFNVDEDEIKLIETAKTLNNADSGISL